MRPDLDSLLRDKPALRFSVARTPEESQQALEQYRRDYGSASCIRTAERRAELVRLIEELCPT